MELTAVGLPGSKRAIGLRGIFHECAHHARSGQTSTMGRMAYGAAKSAALRLAWPPSLRAVAIEAALVPPDTNFSPRFEVEFFENMLDVFLDGARTAFENLTDIVVSFSGDDPLDDFEFAPGQIRRLGLGYAQALRMAISTSVPGGHDDLYLAIVCRGVHTHNSVCRKSARVL
jgi:hypothetical protein